MRTRLGLALLPLLLLPACSSIKVGEISPDFDAFATTYAPLSVEDNQDGTLAADLRERLATHTSGLAVVDAAARYQLLAELTDDKTERSVSHDTERRTVRRRDREGKIIGSYQKIVRYDTSAVTSRNIAMSYRLLDVSSGEQLWSATTQRSDAKRVVRSHRSHYPKPPTHPAPPDRQALVEQANEAATRSLGKQVRKALKKQGATPGSGTRTQR